MFILPTPPPPSPPPPQIERMVDRWSGSIEAGVTLIRPEELDFPNTMTDIDFHTWMLSGSAVMRDGQVG